MMPTGTALTDTSRLSTSQNEVLIGFLRVSIEDGAEKARFKLFVRYNRFTGTLPRNMRLLSRIDPAMFQSSFRNLVLDKRLYLAAG
jgi:hypothetical protein